MKLAGWLWAWLKEYADIACLGAGIGCTAVFGFTWWLPFVAAAVVLLCAAPVIRGTSQRQRKRPRMDLEHPAVKAAAQRDPEVKLLYDLWALELDPETKTRKEQR